MMFDRKKAMEMSMGMIVAIVIGLVLLSICLYVIYGMSKQSSAVNKCEAQGGRCIGVGIGCPSDIPRSSVTPCKTESTAKTYDGRCCFQEIE